MYTIYYKNTLYGSLTGSLYMSKDRVSYYSSDRQKLQDLIDDLIYKKEVKEYEVGIGAYTGPMCLIRL